MVKKHKRKTAWKWCWSKFKGWKLNREHKRNKREGRYKNYIE